MANKKRAKRRKIARKAIEAMLAHNLEDPYSFDNKVTEQLTDREFDRVFKEIRKARFVISWKGSK